MAETRIYQTKYSVELLYNFEPCDSILSAGTKFTSTSEANSYIGPVVNVIEMGNYWCQLSALDDISDTE